MAENVHHILTPHQNEGKKGKEKKKLRHGKEWGRSIPNPGVPFCAVQKSAVWSTLCSTAPHRTVSCPSGPLCVPRLPVLRIARLGLPLAAAAATAAEGRAGGRGAPRPAGVDVGPTAGLRGQRGPSGQGWPPRRRVDACRMPTLVQHCTGTTARGAGPTYG